MVAGGSVGAVRRVDLSRLEPILRHLFGWLDADGRQVELDIPAEDVPEEREGLDVVEELQHCRPLHHRAERADVALGHVPAAVALAAVGLARVLRLGDRVHDVDGALQLLALERALHNQVAVLAEEAADGAEGQCRRGGGVPSSSNMEPSSTRKSPSSVNTEQP